MSIIKALQNLESHINQLSIRAIYLSNVLGRQGSDLMRDSFRLAAIADESNCEKKKNKITKVLVDKVLNLDKYISNSNNEYLLEEVRDALKPKGIIYLSEVVREARVLNKALQTPTLKEGYRLPHALARTLIRNQKV